MKLLKNLFFPLMLLLLMFTSCERENVDDSGTTVIDPTEITTNPLIGRSTIASGEGLDLDCFIINFPFSFVDEEGIEYPINSEADFENLASDSLLIIVDFVYPLSVTMDDEEISVADSEALGELFTSCVPDGGWEDGDFPAYVISLENSCLEHIYPLTLMNESGNEIIVEDEEAYEAALLEEDLLFVFPMTLLETESGNEITVNNVDALFNALFSCNDFEPIDSTWNWDVGFEYLGCYMVELPMNVIVDGETVTVNTHEELCDLMLQGNLEGYAYPLNLIDEEGDPFVVNSEEELNEALEDCDWIDFGFEGIDLILLMSGAFPDENIEACYEIHFPISINVEGEPDVVFNSLEDILTFLETEQFFQSLNYPITVTLNADGSAVVLEDSEAVIDLTETCNP